MQRWEYLRDDDITEETLDRYGANGWELVAAFAYTPDPESYVIKTYVFKRPKS